MKKDNNSNLNNTQMHILDKFFIVTMIVIIIIAFIIDIVVNNIGFPVYLLKSVYLEYILWFILLIYSAFKFEKNDKPYFAKWYMFFVIPFIHIAIMFVVTIIGNIILFN